MDKETMQQFILEALSKKLGDGFQCSIQQVLKTNQKLDGLTILQKGECISPTIYLEPFYKALEDGAAPNDVIDGILLSYFQFCGKKQMPFDARSVMDFGQIKDRLYVVLINRHRNTELLQDIPHSLFLDDFAATIRCLVNVTGDGISSFLVHNSHLGLWGTGPETLLRLAVPNTRRLFGLELKAMQDVLAELNPFHTGGSFHVPIWIMTNRKNAHGAATALFDDVLKDFAKTHGSFYVVFSSVHELLLIPETGGIDIGSVTEINREVNASEVREEEILGTRAYYYSSEKGFIL
ncbi:MAG: hypothetical protein K2K70_00185 [Lachnospiraceae bacterium]|nr:hypothetical protein [Lachnospiraceae bacterium]